VIRGAVRPGAIATYVYDDENPAPVVDRGAAPQAVREALASMAALPPDGMLKATGVGATKWDRVLTKADLKAFLAVPAWARPRSDRKPQRRLPPISGGSDVPISESSDPGGQVEAPHVT